MSRNRPTSLRFPTLMLSYTSAICRKRTAQQKQRHWRTYKHTSRRCKSRSRKASWRHGWVKHPAVHTLHVVIQFIVQIKMYPRTSIDNAKAVRQSAHTLQGHLAVAAGKRIAKYMPKAVGAWLCGLYDADRSVTEATQNSLRQVFNTPEKIQSIRKAYQQPILEYCRDAIDRETSLTLSDERTVSPDDAQAKYSRVISACIALVGSLLSNLQTEDLSKLRSDYESLLGDKKLWDFASHSDPSIRRSVHRFLKTCISKQPSTSRSIIL
jgi:hypothetical protein